MRTRVVVCLVLLPVLAALALPEIASAQTGAIAGEVTDATGGVLPGVTVNATSPSAIDIRTAVTDGAGRYVLTALVPGTYAVEFTLAGFSIVRREGVALRGGFTANIDIRMAVGGVDETVTVIGATPTVDVRNVRTQAVLDDETLNLLPNAQNVSSFGALTLGVNITGNTGGVDVGGTGGETGSAAVHANRQNDMKVSQDGMSTNHSMAANGGIMNWGMNYNMESIAEVTMASSGMSADTETAGIQLNYIPKDGGNTFSLSGRASFTNSDFQSDNLSDELKSRGATTGGEVKELYDYGFSGGGPIRRDRAWFYSSHRWWDTQTYVPGQFFNAVQGQRAPNGVPLYAQGERAHIDDPNREHSGRITVQASSKDKLTYFGNIVYAGVLQRLTGSFLTPEAGHSTTSETHLSQATWTRAQSNRVLLEGGFTYLHNPFIHIRAPGVGDDDVPILGIGQSGTFVYNAWSFFGFIPYNDDLGGSDTDQVNARGSLSYVTGSHSFKFGGTWMHGWIINNGSNNSIPGFGPVTVTTFFGNPISLTQWNHPQFNRSDYRNMALYAQDQWTLGRITLNLGVRGDFFNGWVPDQVVPDTAFTKGFAISRIDDIPSWQDVSPRLGVAWDVTGDGKTAIKASAGRYVAGEGTGFPQSLNPATRIASSASRQWIDRNADFFPDANELGPLSNAAFGTPVITSFWDDDVTLDNRQYTWQMSAGIDRELRENVRLSATYFRTQHFNQRAADNLSVTPADFDPFCVMAPSNPRLPGGGGSQICGFYDQSFDAIRRVPRTLNTLASNFGDASEIFDGVDIETRARFANGALLQGGVAVGQFVNESCFVVDSPQASYQCRNESPWWNGGGQIKFSGSYPLPYGLALSAVFQNIQPPEIRAQVTYFNNQIAPSLGRNLSTCPAPTGPCSSTISLDVIQKRNSAFEDRISMLDFRVMRDFRGDSFGRVRITLDLYNALNAAPVLSRNQAYVGDGRGWGAVNSYLRGRLIKLGAQLSWE
ncbi:MAG: TonB-dependent receptor [Acidimicrobiia bacterium]|nr:TonB-dependent receptor [Acidimicrobiia bacterium]